MDSLIILSLLLYFILISHIFMYSFPFIPHINTITKIIDPIKRHFLPLQQIEVKPRYTSNPTTTSDSYSSASSFTSKYIHVHSKLRVLQFNILADGLSGLRKDNGGFSRVPRDAIMWDNRKDRLIKEITQYDPDIITLQECDHYYDYFLPQLSGKGYNGIYAPKPASACLEVSQNADGCCIFVKRDKIKICSSETITYALSRAEVLEDSDSKTKEDKHVRVQNQVALVMICELISSVVGFDCPSLILATTHLKAMKTGLGERHRVRQIEQLLGVVNKTVISLQRRGKSPTVILTGDLNASPTDTSTGYPSLAYKELKSHRLRFRSVLNDDTPINYEGVLGRLHHQHRSRMHTSSSAAASTTSSLSQLLLKATADVPVWTTWKARTKKNKETVAKHCIDYILYSPLHSTSTYTTITTSNYLNHTSITSGGPRRHVGIQAVAVLDLYDDKEVTADFFPNAMYPSDHIAIAADLQIIEEL